MTLKKLSCVLLALALFIPLFSAFAEEGTDPGVS